MRAGRLVCLAYVLIGQKNFLPNTVDLDILLIFSLNDFEPSEICDLRLTNPSHGLIYVRQNRLETANEETIIIYHPNCSGNEVTALQKNKPTKGNLLQDNIGRTSSKSLQHCFWPAILPQLE